MQGSPGIPGQPGRDGLSCRSELNYLTGSVLVRHSQSSSIPLCEEGEEQLWDGYSLLYIEGNERAHHQDLGMMGWQTFKTISPKYLSNNNMDGDWSNMVIWQHIL